MSENARATELLGGKYEILEPLGHGGMATVFRARTHGADGFTKPVAVKRVLPVLSRDPEFARMFVEEARVVAGLQHPNITQVHDFGRDEAGNHYIVMDWVEGLNLHQWVRSFVDAGSQAPWPFVAAIGIEVLRALCAAHERLDELDRLAPVIHRDVCPTNVLLARSGVVKLADFGLAVASDRVWHTNPGTFKGKLGYVAPELLHGEAASPQTDIYSLGVVLYETLSGQRLFQGGDGAIVLEISRGHIPPLGAVRPDAPAALAEVVHRALATKPADRFERARHMLRALADILRRHPEPTDAEPLGATVVAAMRAPQNRATVPDAEPAQTTVGRKR